MRGFVSGIFWGGVVSVLGLGVVSELAPMHGAKMASAPVEKTAPAAAVVEPTPEAASSTPAPKGATPTAPPEAKAVEPAVVVTPEPTAKKTAPAVKTADAPLVAPADKPAPVAAEPVVIAPKSTPNPPAPNASSATPALGQPEPLPLAPVLTAPLDVQPKPVVTLRPVVPDADSQPAAAELPPIPPLTPEEQALLDQAVAPEPEPSKPEPNAKPGSDAPASMVPTPKPAPAPSVTPAAPDVATPTPPAEPSQKAEVVVLAPAPVVEPTAPLRHAPGLLGTAAGVTVGRLPKIGDDAKTAAKTDATDANATDANGGLVLTPSADQPAVDRFAAAFENPDNKPLFAIVLMDTGGPDVDRKALAKLPFPVTFAIDPTAPDATTAAAIYREAGQEVVMLATGIPDGATAADLEVTFQAHQSALPEAVAVMDIEDGGFQNNRPLATEVVPVVKGQGRGIVTWDKGLNAGDQVARRDGVPSATVFRRLDGANENPSTLRRYLDRAAFKAAQDGRVTVVGKTTPETVTALMEWAVEGRAASVALAPISAVLVKP